MNNFYAWAAIAVITLAATTGDVLLAYSMKRVGDVGELWQSGGIVRGWSPYSRDSHFFSWRRRDGGRFL